MVIRHLYIFDYNAGCIFHVDMADTELDGIDDTDIIIEYGLNPDECNWMFTEDELEIIDLENPNK